MAISPLPFKFLQYAESSIPNSGKSLDNSIELVSDNFLFFKGNGEGCLRLLGRNASYFCLAIVNNWNIIIIHILRIETYNKIIE